MTDNLQHECNDCGTRTGQPHRAGCISRITAPARPDRIANVREVWNIACPKCGDCEQIDIAATVWVRLCADGTDTVLASCGDYEWTEHHAASCNACGFHRKVREFRTGGAAGGGQ